MTPAQHREQLIGLLCEAAEIEHCLMCTYLYAAFSLKQFAAEGLTEDELVAVRRWRVEIMRIATDEMLHLALVNNLLIAVGAPPHYRRFNFPISNGLFPADVAVALLPLDAATLDHFVYLERPLRAADQDASSIVKTRYERRVVSNRISAFAEDYRTVGELYEGIESSFETLIDHLGADRVFVGPSSSQLTTREFRLVGLHAVHSMQDVRSAIHLIRHQGEGSESETAGSHYARFVAIRTEWRILLDRNPAFAPARPAARNPVMRSPVTEERIQILAEPAGSVLDVANAVYYLMLQQLVLLSDDGACRVGWRRVLADQSLGLMRVLTDLGSLLSTLPANEQHPGVTAGLSFTVSRGSHGYPSLATAAAMMNERCTRIEEKLHELSTGLPMVEHAANSLSGFAAIWAQLGDKLEAGAAVTTSSSMPASPVSVPAAPPSPATAPSVAIEVARAPGIELHFEGRRCIHSRHCVLEEPAVFIANQPGAWLHPEAVPLERVVRGALKRPSGAIRYLRTDGGSQEEAPPVNTLRVRENGPLAIHADLRLADSGVQHRATLCRCGQSKNKPYCDGSHGPAGFVATGEPTTRESEPLPVRNGPLSVQPLKDGPLEVRGALEVCSGTGRTIDRVTATRFCRCGHSNNKPFCDGTHAEVGFLADGT